jgi:hypothetical protein
MTAMPAALVLISVVLGNPLPGVCPSTPVERYEPRSFLGYACEDDCERHKAGFAWAESNGVADLSACATLDPAAAEGCRAFVEEPMTPEQAGERWARENEIEAPCLCAGAGERFGVGCSRAVSIPAGTTQ